MTDIKVNIATPSKIVIDNGTIVIDRSDTIEFTISSLKYSISFFEPDENGKTFKTEIDGENNKLDIKIGVKKDTIDSIFSKAIPLGHLNIDDCRKELSFMFSARSLDGDKADFCDILFSYTWYLEK